MRFFKEDKAIPNFTSRSAAFDWMFADLMAKGNDALEAAEQAAKFADIIATNKALPAAPPKPATGLDAAIGYIKQVAALKQEHPEVWELITGAAGGLISTFAVLTSPSAQQTTTATPAEVESIDFDSLE